MMKGPFSYSGNKFRIWKSYLKVVMDKYDKVHEPFIGSGVCVYNSKSGGMCTDVDEKVVMLHNALGDPTLSSRALEVYHVYFPNGISTKEGYDALRKVFNHDFTQRGLCQENIHMLYVLLQLAFNSLLRFGPNGYNVPYGEKSIDIKRIIDHADAFSKKEIIVSCGNYDSLDLNKVDMQKDLIYFDPPYVASKFQYGGWNDENEEQLLNYIDNLNNMGYSFILSNTFSHRGQINERLTNWSKAYNCRLIKMSYNAWSARVKSVETEINTVEVLITNLNWAFNELQCPHANDSYIKTALFNI
jgi:DNA adenine methylase Dam